jgi:CAAX prenyl protease-like protein
MKEYLHYTRAPWYSFLFALPLLLLYHLAVLVANWGQQRAVINAADGIVQSLLNQVGVGGWLGSWSVVAVGSGILAYRADPLHRKGPVRTGYFWILLAEATVYALLFGTGVALLTSLLLPARGFLQIGGGGVSFGQSLATGLGAGLYEELVFRLLLTGGLIWGLNKVWKQDPAPAVGMYGAGTSTRRERSAGPVVAAVLISSFLFSLFHYIGPFGDPFQVGSFTFRFVAGIVLAALFALRGFAAAAWTHSLYDVFLLVAGVMPFR